MRDLAREVGITERAVQRILSDLEEARYLRREREGRRTRYEVDLARPLTNGVDESAPVAHLVRLAGRREVTR